MSVVLALQTKNIIGDDVAYFDILFPYIFLNYVDFSFYTGFTNSYNFTKS